MNSLTLFALIAPLVALIAGIFAGAWIVHRTHQHLSPVPNPREVISELIGIGRSIVRRPQKKKTTLIMRQRGA